VPDHSKGQISWIQSPWPAFEAAIELASVRERRSLFARRRGLTGWPGHPRVKPEDKRPAMVGIGSN